MAKGAKIPTVESKSLSIAVKRAMAARDIKTPALAKESGVPYGTLRRILELNTVADYEQLQKIATALRMPLSRIIADAERLAQDPEIQAESVSPAGERRPVLSVSPADTVPSADDDAPLSTQEIMAMAANKDHNRDLEAETPRD
ncbi:XRE family transcriptional regulator [uncultured Bifidobacterium sp.]|uniref:XRE family transcriptional regulator n=1 Tax=uncultured Bifidobacterium sp. TaxID=165187 RepID=UPI002585DC56|nr:XRE family transcriptional regulator [uncultured Bifidobacterium sp.]